jgi:catechol 2,3-dioxygenase-like lactoylglutathione lyase family enzyme
MTSSTATGLPERLARFGWLERRVRDLPRSIAFHVDGLGFRLLGGCAMTQGDPPGALLGLGDQRLVLRPVPSATAATAATAGTAGGATTAGGEDRGCSYRASRESTCAEKASTREVSNEGVAGVRQVHAP